MELNDDEFYVKRIAGRKYKRRARHFLIEWDDYPKEKNTWEVEGNLLGNTKLIAAFEQQLARENPGRKNIVDSRRKVLLMDAWDPEVQRSDSVSVSSADTDGETGLQMTRGESGNNRSTRKRSAPQGSASVQRVTSKKISKADNVVAIMVEWERIRKVTKDNVVYKQFFNSVNASRQVAEKQKQIHPLLQGPNKVFEFTGIHPPVSVINEVDDEVFPRSFSYIDSLVFSRDVEVPDPDFLVKCQCTVACNHYPTNEPCHETVAYDKHGHLQIQQGVPIYECNSACHCDASCSNRVVQRGRQVPLQIFKTENKGWGVRAMSDIRKGAFVEEYLGEVITESEGESRGKNVYDKLNCSYLFDMDFMSDLDENIPVKYVIDSFLLGNASHFFNHSCRPNLAVFVVYHDSGDPQFHRMAFFASRNIRKGEELTFDYMGHSETSKTMTTSGKFPCYCDARKCRRWIHK